MVATYLHSSKFRCWQEELRLLTVNATIGIFAACHHYYVIDMYHFPWCWTKPFPIATKFFATIYRAGLCLHHELNCSSEDLAPSPLC